MTKKKEKDLFQEIDLTFKEYEKQKEKELIQEIAFAFKEWAEDIRQQKKRLSRLDIKEFLMYLADGEEEVINEFRKNYWKRIEENDNN